MKTMDQINLEHGRGTIRLGSASPLALNAARTWHLRQEHRSPRYTTLWDELPVARGVHRNILDIPAVRVRLRQFALTALSVAHAHFFTRTESNIAVVAAKVLPEQTNRPIRL